jgi:tetratricopeptide (TPR) repeat protein
LDKTFRHDLAVTYNNLGLAHARLKQPEDAERCFRNALGFQQQLVTEQPRDAELNSSLGGIANNLGIVRQGWGKHAEAAESFALAIEHQKQALKLAANQDRYRTLLAKHYDNYRRALAALGRTDEALAAGKLADRLDAQE